VELLHRPVRIYKPSKSTMQSGKAGLNHWRIDFDTLAGSGRWINPLMGWASSADYMQGTSIKFQTEEEAVRFCEKQGWEYIVQKPNVQPFKPKTYSENYTYVPYVSVSLPSQLYEFDASRKSVLTPSLSPSRAVERSGLLELSRGHHSSLNSLMITSFYHYIETFKPTTKATRS
ncbi:ETC complex I subunit conserved region-domain-containing protein, partial [Mrakia frigida]|uniref:ETC complex I subunit n=1 Tax=Mrakia frigida TaxID=29902 RepID=UPI003FCC116F